MIYIYTHAIAYTYIHIHIYIHIYTYIHIYVCVYVCMGDVCVCIIYCLLHTIIHLSQSARPCAGHRACLNSWSLAAQRWLLGSQRPQRPQWPNSWDQWMMVDRKSMKILEIEA